MGKCGGYHLILIFNCELCDISLQHPDSNNAALDVHHGGSVVCEFLTIVGKAGGFWGREFTDYGDVDRETNMEGDA